jgi:type I restriction enzyme M protein
LILKCSSETSTKGFWTATDRLLANLQAAVYEHAVLGLIFLKYVSDSFAQRQQEVEALLRDPGSDYYFLDPADYGGAYPS